MYSVQVHRLSIVETQSQQHFKPFTPWHNIRPMSNVSVHQTNIIETPDMVITMTPVS